VAALGTKDIDFAILVSEVDKFDQLKHRLIDKYGFEKRKESDMVLFSPRKMQIDILPFGELEVDGGVPVRGKPEIESRSTD
jgi:predicted nucleotidyltransferase